MALLRNLDQFFQRAKPHSPLFNKDAYLSGFEIQGIHPTKDMSRAAENCSLHEQMCLQLASVSFLSAKVVFFKRETDKVSALEGVRGNVQIPKEEQSFNNHVLHWKTRVFSFMTVLTYNKTFNQDEVLSCFINNLTYFLSWHFTVKIW